MVVPHPMDVIPWTLIMGVPGGASPIGLNSMNPQGESSWWCLNQRT